MNNYKKRVADSFSRSALYYDTYASVQHESVKLLSNHMKAGCRKLPDGPILEFGCGTGALSEVMARTFSDRRILLTDLSEGMVEKCRQHIHAVGIDQKGLNWKVFDAEDIDEQEHYALIVSGLTIQWFQDIIASLKKIAEALLPDGVFLCSMVDGNSFPEWRSVCSALSLDCTANDLPCGKDLKAALLKHFGSVVHTRHEVPILYPSAQAFFRSLKKTGTSLNRSGKSLSVGDMKKLMNHWNDSRQGREITVTYYIHVLMATKC